MKGKAFAGADPFRFFALKMVSPSPESLAGREVRSVGQRDVAEVVPHPIVAEIGVHPAAARAIDAGLPATAPKLRLDLAPRARPTSPR